MSVDAVSSPRPAGGFDRDAACVMSLDIGTTGVKAILFGCEGSLLSQYYIEYPLIILSDKEIEQDANLWWELSLEAMERTIKTCGIASPTVAALSISSQGISILPTDEAFTPLRNAISWLDIRAEGEMNQILKRYREDKLFQITGKRANPAYVLPKLIWLKDNEPELFNRAAYFLMPHDFIIAKLTGQAVTDHTMAGGTMLYDIRRQAWDEELAAAFGIDLARLPRIEWAGTPIALVTDLRARAIGLNGTLVVTGAQDQKAAAYGAQIEEGMATVSLGTAGALEFLTRQPILDPQQRIPCFSFLAKGLWTLEAVLPTAGASLKWLRNTLFEGLHYNDLNQMVEGSPPGARGVMFLPHLAGAGSPLWQSDARGSFLGISLNTRREDMVRACMEGIACQLRRNIEVAEALGARVSGLRIFGGGSQSSAFCLIIASICNKPVTAYGTPEISCLGAARLAAQGAGLDDCMIASHLLEGARQYLPVDVELYQTHYRQYVAFEDSLLSIGHEREGE